MSQSKRPRKAYRPRVVGSNNFEVARHGAMRAACYTSDMVTAQLHHHMAMLQLRSGEATAADVRALMDVLNVTQALIEVARLGTDYAELVSAAQEVIAEMVRLSKLRGKYGTTGTGLQVLAALIELHDAQLALVTGAQLRTALDRVVNKVRSAAADVERIEALDVPEQQAEEVVV